MRRYCPKCKAPFEWECIQGIRVWREIAGYKITNARCPKCKDVYPVALGKVYRRRGVE